MTESHFVRKTDKCCLLGCLCPDTQYAFISPEGAMHRAHRSKTGCLYGCLSHLWCAGTHDSVKFGSDAVRSSRGGTIRLTGVACVVNSGDDFFSDLEQQCTWVPDCASFRCPVRSVLFVRQGPDFEVSRQVPCIACLLPCCVRCLQRIEIKKLDKQQGESVIGTIKPSTCCDVLTSLCCYGRNHPMYTTKDVDNSDKYVLR